MRSGASGWILFATGLAAVLTARPYTGGWNDGSRLATVECLVDRHTWAIDDSIYVVPGRAARPPYDPANPLAGHFGTQDKLYIDGRFYSDKSPVPAVLMAGVYQAWRWAGGPPAADRPDHLARLLTWLFAGLPFVLTVACVARMVRSLTGPGPWPLILPAWVAFGTLATPYAQHVNNHILLLAVAAAVCETLVRPGPVTPGRAAWLGILAGLAYTIDLGTGPVLTVAVAAWVIVRDRSRIGMFVLAALPFIGLHHGITWAMAGTLGPANANPEFFRWPGSPFQAGNLTGGWNHESPARAFVYALELLFGKKGFLVFAPPLLTASVGAMWLLRRRTPERSAVVALFAWAVGTWLVYAATSRNSSGVCLSVRWFVPLLAPGVLALAVLVREVPSVRRPLAVLMGGGVVLNIELVGRGPWSGSVPYLLWPVLAGSLIGAGIVWSHPPQAQGRPPLGLGLPRFSRQRLSRPF